ncbi:hypothetical protein [Microbacterium terregens]|jgi:hypothetical protein|uniref:Uncharacterized protein n=1 Tax=Microbacterium terregens TaxID=69363 RepID=A0ABV5SXM3_9MICO
MGLFTPRPEEPAEWAGLPSEPLEPGSGAESLGSPTGYSDPLGILGPAVESIVIPVLPAAEIARTASDPAAGEPPESAEN